MDYTDFGFNSKFQSINGLAAQPRKSVSAYEQAAKWQPRPFAPPTFISKGTIQTTDGGVLELLDTTAGTTLFSVNPDSGLTTTGGDFSVMGTTNLGSSVSMGGSATLVDKNLIFTNTTNGNAYISMKNAGNNERAKMEINTGGLGVLTADRYTLKGNTSNYLSEGTGPTAILADSLGTNAFKVINSSGSVVAEFNSAGNWFFRKAGYLELLGTIAAPGTGATNSGRLFIRDNGSGKQQLAMQFDSGTAVTIVTEP